MCIYNILESYKKREEKKKKLYKFKSYNSATIINIRRQSEHMEIYSKHKFATKLKLNEQNGKTAKNQSTIEQRREEKREGKIFHVY